LFDNPVGYLTSLAISHLWVCEIAIFSGSCSETEVSKQFYYCFDEQVAKQKKENEEYIKEMFLSYKQRLEWGVETFESLNMRVYTETNISSELYNDDSILLNSTGPLFMVVAEKNECFLLIKFTGGIYETDKIYG
jgi:hypothetical protein